VRRGRRQRQLGRLEHAYRVERRHEPRVPRPLRGRAGRAGDGRPHRSPHAPLDHLPGGPVRPA
jgi:hypothetical protein